MGEEVAFHQLCSVGSSDESKQVSNNHHYGITLQAHLSFKLAVLNLSGTRDQFQGRQFFHRPEVGDHFRMIQAHCIYCTLYFYYYYISSTSDHQALDPGGWGPWSLSRASQVVLEIEEPNCKSSRRKKCGFDP